MDDIDQLTGFTHNTCVPCITSALVTIDTIYTLSIHTWHATALINICNIKQKYW